MNERALMQVSAQLHIANNNNREYCIEKFRLPWPNSEKKSKKYLFEKNNRRKLLFLRANVSIFDGRKNGPDSV